VTSLWHLHRVTVFATSVEAISFRRISMSSGVRIHRVSLPLIGIQSGQDLPTLSPLMSHPQVILGSEARTTLMLVCFLLYRFNLLTSNRLLLATRTM
jgi:hypothetical protein